MTSSSRSRRDVIKFGAATAGTAAFGPATAAGAAPRGDVGGVPVADTGGAFHRYTDAVAPRAPGTQYVTISGIMLHSARSTTAYTTTFGELSAVDGSFVHALDLPQGANITELVTYFVKSGGADLVTVIGVGSPDEGSVAQLTPYGFGSTSGAPVSPAVQALVTTITPPVVVDRGAHSYMVIVNPDANAVLQGVRVGYTSSLTGFVPVTPARVYDSRMAVFGGTRISAGENRTVSVKDRRSLADGSVDLTDLVPLGAAAIAYNVTVADSVDSGFLALTPGDATGFAASTINWGSSGTVVANGTTVAIDVNRAVKVFCGTGAAHVIIDVVGYYVPL